MRNNTQRLLAVAALAGAVIAGSIAGAGAQEWYGAATWQVSFPAADTKDFVSETSFRGVGLDFRKVVAPKTTAGILLGWNVFYERTSGTSEIDNVTITGTQDRTINSFPIMVGLHRYFGERRGNRPYVGLSAGAMVIIQSLEVGVYGTREDDWDWGLVPEAGIVIPTSTGGGIIINGRYNWSFTSQNLAGEDQDFGYWGINVGFIWEQY